MIFNIGSTAFAKIIIQMNFFSRKKDTYKFLFKGVKI